MAEKIDVYLLRDYTRVGEVSVPEYLMVGDYFDHDGKRYRVMRREWRSESGSNSMGVYVKRQERKPPGVP